MTRSASYRFARALRVWLSTALVLLSAQSSPGLIVAPPGCGNGSLEGDEECDDGGACIGGPGEGSPCQGPAQCPGGACRPVGGDGCAANCTREEAHVLTLDPALSSLRVETEVLRIPLALSGQLTLRTGKPRPSTGIDETPITLRASEIRIAPVQVRGLGCLCLAGKATVALGPGNAGAGAVSCGGPLQNVDVTSSIDHDIRDVDPSCTEGTREMPGQCANAVCEGDSNAKQLCRGSFDCGGNQDACIGVEVTSRAGTGQPGSALMDLHLVTRHEPFNCQTETDSKICVGGATPGSPFCLDDSYCSGGSCVPAKGPDGVPCTGDDPFPGGWLNIGEGRGPVPLVLLPIEVQARFTTGAAAAEVLDANAEAESRLGAGEDCGGRPCETEVSGSPFTCTGSQPSGNLAGIAFAAAFPSLDLAGIGDSVTTLVLAAGPHAVVGTGTPASCTEQALDDALAGGSLVTFDCGPDPVTITLTSEKVITAATTIDGEGRVTLSGGGAVRIFTVDVSAALDVRNLTIADGRAEFGGGIANGGTLTLTNCTLKGNSAASFGGGIHNYSGTVKLTNCTLSGNSAGSFGGGIANHVICDILCPECGSVVVTNSTFSGNGANVGAGGIDGRCPTSVTNSIIASSSGANCGGGVTDGGHNLQFPGTSCGTTIPSLDPLLDPAGLKDNGGPTQTIALLPGSPAINAGDPAVCASSPMNGLDQRGYVRPAKGYANCSIGAFEYNASALTGTPTATGTASPSPSATPSATPTATGTSTIVPPTATPTRTPSATATAIATSTSTPVRINTPTPSLTPRQTATSTQVVGGNEGGGGGGCTLTPARAAGERSFAWVLLPILLLWARRQRTGAVAGAGLLRERNFLPMAQRFVDDHQRACITATQLFVGIEQLDTVDGAVGGDVDVQLVAHANRLHLRRLLVKTQVRDVVPRVVGQLHRSHSPRAKVLHHDGDYQPVAPVFNCVHLNLLRRIGAAAPGAFEWEIKAELLTRATPGEREASMTRSKDSRLVRTARAAIGAMVSPTVKGLRLLSLPAAPFLLALCLAVSDAAAQDSPREHAWWAFQERAYPLGHIPAGAEARAFGEIERAHAVSRLGRRSAADVDRWVSIGPAPILVLNVGFWSGRVAAIAVDPSAASHWLIGTANGGVWETRDAGATWTAKTDDQAALAIGAVTFAPSNPSVIYAGTGQGSSTQTGQGLLKSNDGGATWTLVAASTFARTAFSDIKVHPTDPSVLLAATLHGWAGSPFYPPDPIPNPPPRGIFKSIDGGDSWSQWLNGEATDLEVDPGNFNNQYAGLGDFTGSPVNGAYRSTDAGETWSMIDGPWLAMEGGVGRVELALAPSNPNVLYASIQDAFDGRGPADFGLLGLFRTDNAWDPIPVWRQIPTGATDDGTGVHGYCGWNLSAAFGQCDYDHEIIVDPTDADVLYAGGIPLWKFDGTSWTHAVGIHVDQQSMAWAGNRLIVGSDGGVFSSTDGGVRWSNHNSTLAITQFYKGALHPTDPNSALAGSQDNGFERWTGRDTWRSVFGYDGLDVAISSTHPQTDWALAVQLLQIFRLPDLAAGDVGIDKTGAPFMANLEKCPANDDVFIGGTDNLWKSTDFFTAEVPSWSANGPEMGACSGFSERIPPPSPASVTLTVGGCISALGFAASDATCRTYAFATGGGQILLTADGGASWIDLDPDNVVPNRYVSDLAFAPTDGNRLYVTLSGFDEGTLGQPGHVFKTTNALATTPTWSNVSPPADLPYNSIAVDPADPHLVYAGADVGVWKSGDAGGSWAHLGPDTGMPNVPVYDLEIHPVTRQPFAFTFGRGAFVLACRGDAECDDQEPGNGAETCDLVSGRCQAALAAATATPTASVTSTFPTTATYTPTASPTRTATPTPTTTPSSSPSVTPTVSPTGLPTSTATPTRSATPLPSATATPTRTLTPRQTATSTPTATPVAGGNGGDGCTLTPSHAGHPSGWLLVPMLLVQLRARRRKSRGSSAPVPVDGRSRCWRTRRR